MFKFISKENIHNFLKILTLSECAFSKVINALAETVDV